ncbi:ImuA protein [Chelatococcus sp. SYSU_G07232]|uniref:ImuA protein n=1 Tax=Chelatococcus albus TaxID=3047466 RepID=A0ABT7AHW7_9HYPH|nr:ImuA protein [Chelatococcus sp. SYSU_G07232]MDJ1158967.1 ImuA protein [Chelatococcus sp. SYSU_G07232]
MDSVVVSTTLRGRATSRGRERDAAVAHLRRLLPRLEHLGTAERPALPLGVAAVDACLPRGGLAADALHEIVPESYGDMPAAFGFLVALAGRLLAAQARAGDEAQAAPEAWDAPLLLVVSARGLADCGRLYGPGLQTLGLDPGRLTLVEAGDERDALWALEEIATARAAPVAAGCLGADLDLTASRRLHLAAGTAGLPLLLLRPRGAEPASAAATRWRIAAAAAGRDRFGSLRRPRWRAALARCRNGHPGAWVLEFDHAAHRFGLVSALADHALPAGAGARSAAGPA